MKKPLIGIVTKYYRDESFYNWTNQEISNDLRYALCKNGARVVGILPQCAGHYFQELDEHDTTSITDLEKEELIELVDMCDGIVLQGGMYSSYYEEFIANYCFEKGKPILGICAGFNCMIRALGGITKLLEDTSRHKRPDLKYAHKCNIVDKNSTFYNIVKKDNFEVNSIHTYIADTLPKQLKIVAMSDDGQVEVIEGKSDGFYLGIKYHPELLFEEDKIQNDIFVSFIEKCREEQEKK